MWLAKVVWAVGAASWIGFAVYVLTYRGAGWVRWLLAGLGLSVAVLAGTLAVIL